MWFVFIVTWSCQPVHASPATGYQTVGLKYETMRQRDVRRGFAGMCRSMIQAHRYCLEGNRVMCTRYAILSKRLIQANVTC